MLRICWIAALAVLLAAGCGDTEMSDDAQRRFSDVGGDESIVLFNTAAWLDTKAQTWHLPVHGWIYEPQDSRVRMLAVSSALEQKFALRPDETTQAIFSSRVNWLLADSERGKTLFVRIGETDYRVPPSGPDGHFRKTIELPAAAVARIASDGLLEYSLATSEPQSRVFAGRINLVPPTGVSVISDIDDTIKITQVTDPARLLENTLLREFEAAPGMAGRYREWAAEGVALHFVSSSPWQLYAPLESFIREAGFPAASFHLKSVRFRDETILNLVKKGSETKPTQIVPLLQRWPGRRFLLVGDSGEQDPEVYASLLRRHPEQISRVYIRNVTGATPDDERFRKVFAGIGKDRWQLFTDASSLAPAAAPARGDIFLLRHAETVPGEGPDPALSPLGEERAAGVAEMLAPLSPRAVFTTDYARTRATAKPIADAAGVEPTVYDPGDTAALVERLRKAAGNQVVVGHSNTVPDLVRALGGDPGADIDHAEYDRLYCLRISGDTTETTLLRSEPVHGLAEAPRASED